MEQALSAVAVSEDSAVTDEPTQSKPALAWCTAHHKHHTYDETCPACVYWARMQRRRAGPQRARELASAS
ncbi:MAG: hypothetical protein AAF184_19455 [Pseudomonadota bacterium]